MPITNLSNTGTKVKQRSALMINKVIKNTYLLLGATLMVSALTAYWAMISHAAPLNPILLIIGIIALPMITQACRNSSLGLLMIFIFTAFMGYTLGPILNMYIHGYSNGAQLIASAAGATGIIFVALSFHALTSRKDYSYLGGFLFVASLVMFMGAIAGMFFAMPLLQIIISGGFALISSGYILYTTSAMINGGEDNYISATIMLYISIFNLFISLLRIFGAFAGNRN